MILEALVRHYDKLADDPDSGIAPFGFSRQNISFAVVLNKDGSLFAIEPRTDETTGKPRPVSMVVPGQSKPSGSGINPCFLWDNGTYMLGHVPDDRAAEWAHKRFEAFRDRHLALREAIDDQPFNTVCKFLESWGPASLLDRADTDPLTRPGFGVFHLRNAEQYVHERPSVLKYWSSMTETGSGDEADAAMCLITGREAPIARLHEPKIKRVAGAQSSGATLVSYNDPAYESYGKAQGDNAPVSQRAAFAYATALNRLLADTDHRVQLGDTTCVFWTDAADTQVSDAVAQALGVFHPKDADLTADDGGTRSALADFLARFRAGQDGADTDKLRDPDAKFYILGLSPNAARISVRFWHECTIRLMADRLQRHIDHLQIVGLGDQPPPSIWQLIRATARESKEIKPKLAGELSRALVQDLPIPRLFANAVLQRIRIEGEVGVARAAGLKAYLLTNGISPMDVYLNKEHPSKAYHAGRIFAVLGFIQDKALGPVNAGVVQKNFASAMATPGSVLGRLQKAALIGHIRKLDTTVAEFVNDELAMANCMLRDGPPKTLGPDGQTIFALGYYQETAYLRAMGGRMSKQHKNRSVQGEWMRSKLEVRVADAMSRAGIEYVYEPSAIIEGVGARERYPDFVIRGGGDASKDVYIEVAGYPGEEYDQRHQLKLDAYRKMGVNEAGGTRGRLVVLDYREKGYDDVSVYDALRFLIVETPDTTPSEEQNPDA